MWSGVGASVEQRLAEEARTVSELSGTADALEGLRAVIERRPPRFPADDHNDHRPGAHRDAGAVAGHAEPPGQAQCHRHPAAVWRWPTPSKPPTAIRDVRAIVLTGAGRRSARRRHRVDGADARRAALERAQLAQRVIRAIWGTDKPVLAAVEGAAFGAGTALAAACDRVVAARDARFATTFTKVGLAGDMGAYVSLPTRVGVARARQMLMLPAPIGAQEALRSDSSTPSSSRVRRSGAARRDARRLAAGPPSASGDQVAARGGAGSVARSTCSTGKPPTRQPSSSSDDFVEGISAFREKRPAVFGATEGVRQ